MTFSALTKVRTPVDPTGHKFLVQRETGSIPAERQKYEYEIHHNAQCFLMAPRDKHAICKITRELFLSFSHVNACLSSAMGRVSRGTVPTTHAWLHGRIDWRKKNVSAEIVNNPGGFPATAQRRSCCRKRATATQCSYE